MSDLIKEIEGVLEKHKAETKKDTVVIRWIPICEQYVNSRTASVHLSKGGAFVAVSKPGSQGIPVLVWLKVLIDPDAPNPVIILAAEKP